MYHVLMENITKRDIFDRTELLYGDSAMAALAEARVILFGVGGVGGWCAEGLVRAGIGHLTIVDADCVAVSNINRQIMATTLTVGRPKVDVMKERLLAINPFLDLQTVQARYSEENHAEFRLDDYDYVIDAIDSLRDKISLILHGSEVKGRLFSSMGAALKSDPARIRVAEFWQVKGCPLAAMLRRRMRRAETFPSHRFTCVYDEELLSNKGGHAAQEGSFTKAAVNGTAVHVTAIFGMTLSGLVVNDIVKRFE